MDCSQSEQTNNINSNDILQKNQVQISKIFMAQCNQDYEGATNLILQLLPQIQNILSKCQEHPKVVQAIREYREILPDHCIQQNEGMMDEGAERYYKYLEKVANQQTVTEKKKEKTKNPWTEEEKKLFEEALNKCEPKGNIKCSLRKQDWKQISAYIKTRSPQQVRSHYQKYEKKMKKLRQLKQKNI